MYQNMQFCEQQWDKSCASLDTVVIGRFMNHLSSHTLKRESWLRCSHGVHYLIHTLSAEIQYAVERLREK